MLPALESFAKLGSFPREKVQKMRSLLGVVIFLTITAVVFAQAPAAYKPPRTADGKPDLSGIWQALNTANWNIQDHAAAAGPLSALGAAFSIPGGQGVVEGNEIPYRPEALKKRQENAANWMKLDPEVKC